MIHIPRNSENLPSLYRSFFGNFLVSIKQKNIRAKTQTIGVAIDFNNTVIFRFLHKGVKKQGHYLIMQYDYKLFVSEVKGALQK